MAAHEKNVATEGTGIDRREFLRLSSAVAAAGALASAGCQVPQESIVPLNDMPEAMADGLGPARYFRTVLDGSPVLVKTRESRPVLITPVTGDGSGRGLSARHHAALMDLYDPDRARGPQSIRRRQHAAVAVNWTVVGSGVVETLKSQRDRVVLLTPPVQSPAIRSVIDAIASKTAMRHVAWSPLGCGASAAAAQAAFGVPDAGRPRIDKADLLIGLGAEFLDRSELGFEAEFAARRSPDPTGAAPMSRFIQLEGRLTLTGANADRRIRVRDSQLALAGAALAHELIVARKLGPLAGDARVATALAPFAIAGTATRIGVDALTLTSIANEMANASGRCLVLAGGSASTSASGPALELVTLILNVTLGGYAKELFDTRPTAAAPDATALETLIADMQAGRVQTLIVAGVNPMYDAPPAMRFGEAIAKVTQVISLNDRVDETGVVADIVAPASHAFECWSDAALPKGIYSIQQPVIQPLHDTRGLLDLLVDWAAAIGDEQALAAATLATTQTVPAPATGQTAPSTSLAFHYLRARAAVRMKLAVGTHEFETAWTELLRSGAWQGTTDAPAKLSFNSDAVRMLSLAVPAEGDLELQLYPHHALQDGRSGNNGWLHELPDPITRITWGGALSMAPRRFDAMKLANGDLIEVDAGHAKVVAPAYRHAGMHDGQVALPLGLGRTSCGPIGAGVGPNAFSLRTLAGHELIASGLRVTIRKVDGNEALAFAQGSDVIDRVRRPLVPVTTLSEYQQDPKAGTEQEEAGPSAWPVHEYPKARWAMTIDLNKCNGCAKCVIGCQAENNIPIVGRNGMLEGREMSWLRIDRYYDAPAKDGGWDAEVWDGPLDVVEEPQTLFEPMMCQHCENAPCETVCPFSATMHSEDGLNQQVYNRCVGTRYCANNCPFKVRRFNYWELSKKQDSTFFRWLIPRIAQNAELNAREPMQMKNNPEVTVRSRGVMEKCSFCVQRIRSARAEATREGRDKDHFGDGEVVTACMEACPTQAITFGDINAPGAKVAELSNHPRAMKLLDSLGVKPSVSYLTKVRNDKA